MKAQFTYLKPRSQKAQQEGKNSWQHCNFPPDTRRCPERNTTSQATAIPMSKPQAKQTVQAKSITKNNTWNVEVESLWTYFPRSIS
jgi:hypothetical protein